MIITRTPLRISLGGGGTDIPSFYRQNDHGFLIAAAISKYVYISVNANFENSILLRYSEVEKVNSVDSVRHPLLRECLIATGVTGKIEISSMADVPSGTGLGSSGSFCVGALKALSLHNHKNLSALELAELACDIEINRLGEPTGKQDQYISAFGGISTFSFKSDGTVIHEFIQISKQTRQNIEENLLLFYTGIQRSASAALSTEQVHESSKYQNDNLVETRNIGYKTRDILTSGDMEAFGQILTEQWKLKYHRQPSKLHQQIDEWIQIGVSSGALGGKLVGAGGGGFLLFYAERKNELRNSMEKIGLTELNFRIDDEGTSVTVSQ